MPNILKIKNLSSERGEHILFKNLTIELRSGEALQIQGLNGSGKTTLLRMLAGIAFVNEGQILWNGQTINKNREEYHKNLIYIGHKLGLKEDLTVEENLQHLILQSGQKAKCSLNKALEKINLFSIKYLCVRDLSAGQCRRVALAKLLLLPNPLWILDEPFTAVDKDGIRLLVALMEKHCQAGGMLIFTSHQELPFSIKQKAIHLS